MNIINSASESANTPKNTDDNQKKPRIYLYAYDIDSPIIEEQTPIDWASFTQECFTKKRYDLITITFQKLSRSLNKRGRNLHDVRIETKTSV